MGWKKALFKYEKIEDGLMTIFEEVMQASDYYALSLSTISIKCPIENCPVHGTTRTIKSNIHIVDVKGHSIKHINSKCQENKTRGYRKGENPTYDSVFGKVTRMTMINNDKNNATRRAALNFLEKNGLPSKKVEDNFTKNVIRYIDDLYRFLADPIALACIVIGEIQVNEKSIVFKFPESESFFINISPQDKIDFPKIKKQLSKYKYVLFGIDKNYIVANENKKCFNVNAARLYLHKNFTFKQH